jgi:AcrR family transcriptional regulator
MTTDAPDRLPGRRREAARNDGRILEAARDVLVEDPDAPVAAVAARAGVGIGALYRRYATKDDLLRRICHEGLLRFIAEAEAAAAEDDAGRALARFLERVVDADLHSLTVRLAGRFAPTEEMWRDAERAGALARALLERAVASGAVRADGVPGDLDLVLEGCAAIRVPDPARTVELRRRHLALLLDGLAAGTAAGLPGPPPGDGEMGWRWREGPGPRA